MVSQFAQFFCKRKNRSSQSFFFYGFLCKAGKLVCFLTLNSALFFFQTKVGGGGGGVS